MLVANGANGCYYRLFGCVPARNINDMKSSLYFQPQTDGYIAIVLPKLKNYEAEMKKLHSKDVYLEKIKNR